MFWWGIDAPSESIERASVSHSNKENLLFQIYIIDSADRKRFEETGQVCFYKLDSVWVIPSHVIVGHLQFA